MDEINLLVLRLLFGYGRATVYARDGERLKLIYALPAHKWDALFAWLGTATGSAFQATYPGSHDLLNLEVTSSPVRWRANELYLEVCIVSCAEEPSGKSRP